MIRRIILSKVNKYTSRWLVLSIDLFIVIQCFIVAYLVRFNFSLQFESEQLFYQIPVVFIAALISFVLIGSHKGVVRHTGPQDAINIFFSASLIMGFMAILVLGNNYVHALSGFTIPLSIIVIHYLLNILVLISSRALFKIIYNRILNDFNYSRKVLIYGAGNSGLITHSALVKNLKHKYRVVGFLDDNPNKIGKTIDRVMVYSPTVLNREFILRRKIKEVIVSIQNISPVRLMEITDNLLEYSVTVKIVPAVDKWIDGKLNVGQIEHVKIEDLLERNPIKINNPAVSRHLKGKTVFVTGAAGSIGSEIAKQVSDCSVKKLILIDQSESQLYDLQQEFILNKKNDINAEIADIRDKERVGRLFKKYQPEIIFHAAAYKHVPLMEENPYEAVRVNVNGTKILADLALKYGVEKFVMISTDKAVNPTNVMGTSKRVAEMYTSCLAEAGKTKFITTRFGNVLGSNGSVVPLFRKQIESGGPITVTHKDITRFFMTISEACHLVLEAGVMGNGGEIYVFDMGESVKIYDVAIKMIQLSGLRFPEDINIEITGLRPGEKLYEELLANDENTLPTYHEKIMIAEVPEINKADVKNKIDSCCQANDALENTEIVSLLKDLVPEYKSNNSVYEKLDKDFSYSD